MSDNKFMLKDQNEDLTICLSEPKDTDLVLFLLYNDILMKTRIITEYDFVYFSTLGIEQLMSGDTTKFCLSCFGVLDDMLPYDEDLMKYDYYMITYAEVKKLTPQEFRIALNNHRGYSMNEIMNQIEIRRKELLPELFG